jgi:cytochrome c peroxidase
MRRLLAGGALLVVAAAALVALRLDDSRWSEAELDVLRSLSIASLDAPRDPSNRFVDRPAASRLGRALFFERRLSANGEVSCASCHQPERGFQDGRPLGRGVGVTRRRTMTILGAAWQPWLFWDGRKDSLWSQALAPLESRTEHGLTRTEVVRTVGRLYRRDYERVFSPLPPLARVPVRASPLGDRRARRAWLRMTARDRDAVNRAFANIGKAIAAYESRLRPGPARFDRYVAGDRDALSARELDGLDLFLGDGHCIDCHSGPLFTNGEFHNTGVGGRRRDLGRMSGLVSLRADEFSCLGRYSDADDSSCALLYAPARAPAGTFKPPSLRNVTRRAPYMRAGQIATLGAVLRHYNRAPQAEVGHSELAPLGLSDDQLGSIVAFLGTLESRRASRP